MDARIVDDGLKGAGHVLVRREHREVLQTKSTRAENSHGDQRRGCFETNAHEHDLTIGVVLGDLQSIERRIANAHVAALRLLS